MTHTAENDGRSAVLALDSDAATLELVTSACGEDFIAHIARSQHEALFKVDFGGLFAVVVCGLPPKEDGAVGFLRCILQRLPQASRILLTDTTDCRALADLLNQGQPFRVLPKTCSVVELRKAINDGEKHYTLQEKERARLDQTLRGSLECLIDTLALMTPSVSQSLMRVQRLARELCGLLQTDRPWHVEVASVFSHIAMLTFREDILAHAQRHELDAIAFVSRTNVVAQRLAARIPELDEVRGLVRTAGRLVRAPTEDHGIAAWIVYLCGEFGRMVAGGITPEGALRRLHEATPAGTKKARALNELVFNTSLQRSRLIMCHELRSGTTFADPVRLVEGTVIVQQGMVATPELLEKLHTFSVLQRLVEPLRVIDAQS